MKLYIFIKIITIIDIKLWYKDEKKDDDLKEKKKSLKTCPKFIFYTLKIFYTYNNM